MQPVQPVQPMHPHTPEGTRRLYRDLIARMPTKELQADIAALTPLQKLVKPANIVWLDLCEDELDARTWVCDNPECTNVTITNNATETPAGWYCQLVGDNDKVTTCPLCASLTLEAWEAKLAKPEEEGIERDASE